MNKENVLNNIIIAAKSVCASRNKTNILVGSAANEDTVVIDDVLVSPQELPRVIAVGLAIKMKVPFHLIEGCLALNLGDTDNEIRTKLKSLQEKYDTCLLNAMNIDEVSMPIGLRRFIIKHNLITRKYNNQVGKKVISDIDVRLQRRITHD